MKIEDLVRYEPETGKFFWKTSRPGASFNSEAGHITGRGYVVVKVAWEPYLGHRLAWYLMTGEWPYRIDHKDNNFSNNKLDNLRNATDSQNSATVRKPSRNKSG